MLYEIYDPKMKLTEHVIVYLGKGETYFICPLKPTLQKPQKAFLCLVGGLFFYAKKSVLFCITKGM